MKKAAVTLQIREGSDLILLSGLPRDSLRAIRDTLQADGARPLAKYEGVPAPINDWGPLYPKSAIDTMLRQAGAFVLKYKDRSTENRIPTPRRIILLYVPSNSGDHEDLLKTMDFTCFPFALLSTEAEVERQGQNPIGWRHSRSTVEDIVYRTLDQITAPLNALKAEITDKRMSPLSLPARNFFFPDKLTKIEAAYRTFIRNYQSIETFRNMLLPARFDREMLHAKAFKGIGRRSDRFFQDHLGRVFPPDPYHGRVRVEIQQPPSPAPNAPNEVSEVMHVLRQRYRFGVTVRNGELHYDMQYPAPRKLAREPMECGKAGPVWVSGSHANISVSDCIWAPDGTIEPRSE